MFTAEQQSCEQCQTFILTLNNYNITTPAVSFIRKTFQTNIPVNRIRKSTKLAYKIQNPKILDLLALLLMRVMIYIEFCTSIVT